VRSVNFEPLRPGSDDILAAAATTSAAWTAPAAGESAMARVAEGVGK